MTKDTTYSFPTTGSSFVGITLVRSAIENSAMRASTVTRRPLVTTPAHSTGPAAA